MGPDERGGAPSAGYRHLDHPADVIVEAWGPTRASCLEQAVAGLVATFVAGETAPTATHEATLAGDDSAQALVDLLDEVLYVVDARDAVPLRVEVGDGGETLAATFHLAPLAEVELTGAVPKAVTYHDLVVAGDADGWWCRVTVDV